MTAECPARGWIERALDRIFDARKSDLEEVRAAGRETRAGARNVAKMADELVRKAQEITAVAAAIRGR